jgi:DNA-binding NarL/FixJ family response regulator
LYKVIIADDHPILLTGLERIINNIEGFEVVSACANGLEAWNAVDAIQPDIVILDLDMPEMGGLDVASKIKLKYPNIAISILTLHKEESFLVRAIDIGVEGFMLKDFANVEIEKCLIALSKGKKFYSEVLKELIRPSENLPENYAKLSRTERKVLRLISTNKTSKEIADLMFLSPKTIQNHRYNISKKLALEPKNNSLLTWATKFADVL